MVWEASGSLLLHWLPQAFFASAICLWIREITLSATSFVWSSGRVVECRAVNQGDGGSIPPTAVSKLRQYNFFLFTPHLPVSFRTDTKSRWSLLSGVYARGSKRSHTRGKCVTCSGLIHSHWTLNALQKASIWEKKEKPSLMPGYVPRLTLRLFIACSRAPPTVIVDSCPVQYPWE